MEILHWIREWLTTHIHLFVWITTGLLFALLLLPLLKYFFGGLWVRQNEILATLNEEALKLYFKQFQPANHDQWGPAQAFKDFYRRQFGKKHFIIPIILLGGIAATLLIWSAFSVIDMLDEVPIKAGHLPKLAVVAIMGGYMYCLYDLIERWSSSAISPSDILGQSFRLVVAVPMAYGLASAFNPAVSLAVAFLIGVFPTKTLMTIARRFAAKKLDAGDLPESGHTELLKLSGIDLKVAECLTSEGITTVLQLAYADPVKLAIRTNLGFSYLIDCVSQALLFIYAGDRFPDFAKATLRGSYEVCDLNHALLSEDVAKKEEAEARFNAIVNQLGYKPEVLRNLFSQVGEDPYTEFLYEAWSS